MKKTSLFLLRSTYFNSIISDNIYPDFYIASIPTKALKKIDFDTFVEMMSVAYEQNFNNREAIQKLQEDYDKYVYYKQLG